MMKKLMHFFFGVEPTVPPIDMRPQEDFDRLHLEERRFDSNRVRGQIEAGSARLRAATAGPARTNPNGAGISRPKTASAGAEQEDVALSAAVGIATGSATLGYLAGGSVIGGVLGDALSRNGDTPTGSEAPPSTDDTDF